MVLELRYEFKLDFEMDAVTKRTISYTVDQRIHIQPIPTLVFLVSLSDEITPANTTEAVPWMSSLKQSALLRKCSNRPNAFELPKSSN